MQRWSYTNSAEYTRLAGFRTWLVGHGISLETAETYARSLAQYCDLRGITSDDLLDEARLPPGRAAGGRQVFTRALFRYAVFMAQGGAAKNAG